MGNDSQEQYGLLTDYDKGTAYSEAVRTLYTNILASWDRAQRAQLALLITSPNAAIDQAAVAANLAVVAAQSGTPTVLVDADLRNASLRQRFGIEAVADLSSLLTEGATLTVEEVASHLLPTFVPGLRVLGAGSAIAGTEASFAARSKSILNSLRQILAEQSEQAGLIIVNGPAVLKSADASLLGAQVDQTFLVLRTRRSTRAQAKLAQEQLQQAHVPLTGVILVNS